MAVTLTEAAAKHVQKYIDRRGKGIGLRVGVKTSGCSGMAYKLEFADSTEPDGKAMLMGSGRKSGFGDLKECHDEIFG